MSITLVAVAALLLAAGSAQAQIAPGFVSPGEINGYSRLYAVDNGSFDFNDAYTVDNSASFAPGSFGRVGYFLQLDSDWVWASMDTFNNDPLLVGVPRAGTGIVENGTIVNNLNVEASGPIISSTGTGQTGIIEFWASNYNANGGGAFGSNNSLFDWKDSGGNSNSNGYGSFQISAFTNAGLTNAENLFAVHRGGNTGGIGDNPGTHPDWTFQNNSLTSNTVRNLEIWVKPPTSAGGALFWDGDTGNWTTSDWLNDVPTIGSNQSTFPQNIADVVNPANITEGTVTVNSNQEAFSLTMDTGTNGSGGRPGDGILNITANTLSINTDATISNTSQVNISSGATLDVTGTLTIDPTATFDNSGTASAGSLAGTGTATLNAGSKLTAGNGTLGGITLTDSAEVEVGGTVTIATLNTPGTGITLTKSGNGTLDVTGNLSLNGDAYTPTAGTLRLSGMVSDGAVTTLTKDGAGTLLLSNNNSYTGTTTVIDGVLFATNSGALGGTGNGTVVNNGGTLKVSGNITTNEDISINGNGAGGGEADAALFSDANTNNIDGQVTTAGNTRIRVDSGRLRLRGGLAANNNIRIQVDGNGDRLEISAPITGGGTLTFENDGTTEIRANSPGYTGNISLNNGVIDLDNRPTGLGSAGTLNIDGDATLRVRSGVNSGKNITLNGGTNNGNGQQEGRLWSSDNDNTLSGTIGWNSNSRVDVNNGSTLNLTGVISGGGDINKVDTGLLNITNSGNSFSGDINVSGGTVAAPIGTFDNAGAVNVSSGATFEISGGGTIAAGGPTINIAGDGQGGVGALHSSGGNNTLDNPVNVSGTTINNSAGGTTLTLNNVSVSPTADVNFAGAGDIVVNNSFGNGGASVTTPGLIERIYTGNTNNASIGSGTTIDPVLNTSSYLAQTPIFTGVLTDELTFNATELVARAGSGNINSLGAVWTGDFTVDGTTLLAGDYSFATRSDDGSTLFVDVGNDGFTASDIVVENGGNHGNRNRGGTVNLAVGTYPIAIAYYEAGGGDNIQVKFGAGATTDFNSGLLSFINPSIQPAFSFTVTPDNDITKTGSGTTTFAAANTYNGTTTIEEGILVAAANNALGLGDGTAATGTTVNSGAELRISGGSDIGNELITLGSGGSAATLSSTAGDNIAGGNITLMADGVIDSDAGSSLTISGAVDLNGASGGRLTVQGAGETTIDGVISGNTNDLHHSGNGVLRLNSGNNYTGTTTVGDTNGSFGGASTTGVLIVNGTTSGQGSYFVDSGATLGGDGTIGLAPGEMVNISDNPGMISPGDGGAGYVVPSPPVGYTGSPFDATYTAGTDAATAGILTITGSGSPTATILDMGGVLKLDFVDPANFDVLMIEAGVADIDTTTSFLEINGSQTFDDIDLTAFDGEIIDFLVSEEPLVGTFSNLAAILGDVIQDGTGMNLEFQLSDDGTTLSLAFGSAATIPEPATILIWSLIGAGLFGLHVRRRRKK